MLKTNPVPSLYCVYFLRSTRSARFLYVGSTPNPRRRLKQHNGISKGGAKRTDAESKRPWQMVALVTGFPSKIAALQFEWAWQNTHLTRHIPREDRISHYNVKDKVSKKGVKYQKPGRVIDKMEDKIRNLQILLRAVSFRRWPLKVRFFSEDVYDQWNEKSIEGQLCVKNGIEAVLDPSALQSLGKPRKKSKAAHLSEFDTWPTTKAIYAIDETYDPFKRQLQHSLTVLKDAEQLACAVCSKRLFPEQDMIIICMNDRCAATSHMLCLAKAFLSRDPNPDSLLPVRGNCPCCSMGLQWVDLMRDTTLRTRGLEQLRRTLKKGFVGIGDTTLPNPDRPTLASIAGSSADKLPQSLNPTGADVEDSDSDDEISYDASFAEIRTEVVEADLLTENESEDDLPLMQKRSKQLRSPDHNRSRLSLGVIPDSEGWNDIEEFV